MPSRVDTADCSFQASALMFNLGLTIRLTSENPSREGDVPPHMGSWPGARGEGGGVWGFTSDMHTVPKGAHLEGRHQPWHPWPPRGWGNQGHGCGPASGRHLPEPHARVLSRDGPARSRPLHSEDPAAEPCAGTAPGLLAMPRCCPELPTAMARLAAVSGRLGATNTPVHQQPHKASWMLTHLSTDCSGCNSFMTLLACLQE